MEGLCCEDISLSLQFCSRETKVGALSMLMTSSFSQSFNPLSVLPMNRLAALAFRVARDRNRLCSFLVERPSMVLKTPHSATL